MIKALNIYATTPFVSELDPDYNALFVNKSEVQAWHEAAKEGTVKGLEPTPIYKHGATATVFDVATLDATICAMLADELLSNDGQGGMSISQADNDVFAARLAIRGFKNLEDDNGEKLEFSTETVRHKGRDLTVLSEEVTKAIPLVVLRAIAKRAKEANTVSGVQAKNSASAS